MKRLIASFGWLMLLLPLISVAGVKTVFSTMISTTALTESRQVTGFTGISTSGSFDVFVKMDGKESLRLEGEADDISKVETIVENGILKIRYKQNSKLGWINTQKKTTVYVSAKELNMLAISGSGNMKIDGTIKTASLQAKISGSGNIELAINTTDFISLISGSGSISVAGNTKNADVVVSGSGNFKGKDLRTDSIAVKVSGSGNAKVYANSKIEAVVSGSGSINYAGNPTVSATKSGSGNISKF